MAIFALDAPALIAANTALWLAAHTLSGYAAHRLPDRWLSIDRGPLRLADWEHRGRWYERTLHIRRWKDRVPEAGAAFEGGISKRRLRGRTDADLLGFAAETRRAELAHWTCLLATPVAVLWNPPIGVVLMAAYGFLANVPFIAIQRYNRARIAHLLLRRGTRTGHTDPPRRPVHPRRTDRPALQLGERP